MSLPFDPIVRLESRSPYRRDERKRRLARGWIWLMLAIAGVVAVAAAWIGRGERPRQFETARAERESATLSDGSSVELNAQTAFVVNFSGRERRVQFEHGEAMFTVTKDTSRPFVVETPAATLRVTGTAFNVRAPGAQRNEVTVFEGAVDVRAAQGGSEARLTPGQQGVVAQRGVEVRVLGESAAQDTVAWRQGQVVFNDTPLREALEHFAAYHVQKIVVDDAIADARLGGRYALNDVNGFLGAVERVLGGRIVREAGGVIRVTAR